LKKLLFCIKKEDDLIFISIIAVGAYADLVIKGTLEIFNYYNNILREINVILYIRC